MKRNAPTNPTHATPFPLANGEATRIVETWGMYQVKEKGMMLSGMLATGCVPSELRDMDKAAALFHLRALDTFNRQNQLRGMKRGTVLDASGEEMPRRGFKLS